MLKQRTALLKSAGSKGHLRGAAREAMTSTLDAWDAQLARAGAPLLAGRMRLVAALRPHVTAAYEAVSGGPAGEASGMNYRSFSVGIIVMSSIDVPVPLETAMLKALAGVRASELDRGVCLVGPHRDELELSVGGLPARGYASHGESWSLALALRLASFALLREGREDPVLILDDVFAELDAGRRDRLAALVAGGRAGPDHRRGARRRPGVLAGARFTVRAGVVAGDG